MQSRKIKFATAAIILIAALLGIHHFGGSIDGATVTWADVITKISTFRPYQCQETIYYKDKDKPVSMTLKYLTLSQRREERQNGQIFIVDMHLCPLRTLVLDPQQKIAGLSINYNYGPTKDPDFLNILTNMKNSQAQRLEICQINGVKAQGFRMTDNKSDITLWADIKTGLPVKGQIIHLDDQKKFVYENFEFDITFDPNIFSTIPPKGYQVYENVTKKQAEQKYEIKSASGPESFVPHSCLMTLYQNNKIIQKQTEIQKTLSLTRIIDEDSIKILDISKQPAHILTLNPKSKNGLLRIDYNIKATKNPDIFQWLAGMKKNDSEKLGVQQIDGVDAEGFRQKDPFNDITIWVDIKTGLPVKMIVKHSKRQRIVYTNFDYKPNLDESLFSTEPSQGYEIKTETLGNK